MVRCKDWFLNINRRDPFWNDRCEEAKLLRNKGDCNQELTRKNDVVGVWKAIVSLEPMDSCALDQLAVMRLGPYEWFCRWHLMK